MFQVVFVLRLGLDVHVAGVPVAVFDAGLRTPVRPHAELGVAEPLRDAIVAERFGGSVERPFFDFRNGLLRGGAARQDQSWRGYQRAQGIASGNVAHGHIVPHPASARRPVRRLSDLHARRGSGGTSIFTPSSCLVRRNIWIYRLAHDHAWISKSKPKPEPIPRLSERLSPARRQIPRRWNQGGSPGPGDDVVGVRQPACKPAWQTVRPVSLLDQLARRLRARSTF